ncbi:MAG: hypothetical protein ACTHL3_08625 [Candidatus Nitrosocosmicus sp.]
MSIENASADYLNPTDISPANSNTVNNIVTFDLLNDFINIIKSQYMDI